MPTSRARPSAWLLGLLTFAAACAPAPAPAVHAADGAATPMPVDAAAAAGVPRSTDTLPADAPPAPAAVDARAARAAGSAQPAAAPRARRAAAPHSPADVPAGRTPAAAVAFGHGILPAHVTPRERAHALDAYYAVWKARYVRHGACGAEQAYVDSSQDAGEPGSITVSEAHGWGMLILAMMGPHDPEARALFDGMVRLFRAHPSTRGSSLMAWDIHAPCTTPAQATSATDGDLDIAFALLVADRVWGSRGAVDYRAEALRQIAELRRTEAHPDDGYMALWEDIDAKDPHHGGTRLSDYMMGHFRAFARASGDAAWMTLVDRGYAQLERLAAASPAGFFPEFMVGLPSSPQPAPPRFLEGPRDGIYAYNSCRLPLRWGLDYLVHGDPRARALTVRLVAALERASHGRPDQVRDGYRLDGSAYGHQRRRLAFLAPLAVGAMVAAEHQPFLDALYADIVAQPLEPGGYYGNTLKLLALIVLAERWIEP